MIQIQWTCPNIEEARKVIGILLKNNLIACANIIPHVESHYRWEEALETSYEVKVYMKTEEHRFLEIEQMIRKHCSYQVPEIVSFKALAVSHPYERWVLEEIKLPK
jgi:periplasmic divalent cation tolerance protein